MSRRFATGWTTGVLASVAVAFGAQAASAESRSRDGIREHGSVGLSCSLREIAADGDPRRGSGFADFQACAVSDALSRPQALQVAHVSALGLRGLTSDDRYRGLSAQTSDTAYAYSRILAWNRWRSWGFFGLAMSPLHILGGLALGIVTWNAAVLAVGVIGGVVLGVASLVCIAWSWVKRVSWSYEWRELVGPNWANEWARLHGYR